MATTTIIYFNVQNTCAQHLSLKVLTLVAACEWPVDLVVKSKCYQKRLLAFVQVFPKHAMKPACEWLKAYYINSTQWFSRCLPASAPLLSAHGDCFYQVVSLVLLGDVFMKLVRLCTTFMFIRYHNVFLQTLAVINVNHDSTMPEPLQQTPALVRRSLQHNKGKAWEKNSATFLDSK